jgi:hypothetical protein
MSVSIRDTVLHGHKKIKHTLHTVRTRPLAQFAAKSPRDIDIPGIVENLFPESLQKCSNLPYCDMLFSSTASSYARSLAQ